VVSGKVGQGLRNRLYTHVMKLSGSDTAVYGAGGLMTRLTVDVNQVQTAINMAIRLAIRAPFLTVGSVVMAIIINRTIGLIFVAATLIITLVIYVIMKRSLPSYLRIQETQDKLSRLSGENLSGARVIRAFARQDHEKAQFKGEVDALTALVIRVGYLSAAMNPLTSFIVSVAIVFIVWMGAGFAFTANINTGEIIALVNYMNQTLVALIVVANLVVLFTRALASAKRLDEVMSMQPSVTGDSVGVWQDSVSTDEGEESEDTDTAPTVCFDDVSFAYYEGADDALSEISFSIKPGETVGLIGGTGSGKTTIVNLILRFFDVQKGSVMIGGIDAKDLVPVSLREGIGLVSQNAALFSGSIRQNMAIAAQDASDDEIWSALETAQGADFVRLLPDGLDSRVEEGGRNYSGGQRQRLTIARALVKKPRLLILDDSSSALDYATDAALRRALARERQERADLSVLVVSQRIAAIRTADKIIVLDDGRIVGQGTHDELYTNNDIYYETCVSQGVSPAAAGEGATS